MPATEVIARRQSQPFSPPPDAAAQKRKAEQNKAEAKVKRMKRLETACAQATTALLELEVQEAQAKLKRQTLTTARRKAQEELMEIGKWLKSFNTENKLGGPLDAAAAYLAVNQDAAMLAGRAPRQEGRREVPTVSGQYLRPTDFGQGLR